MLLHANLCAFDGDIITKTTNANGVMQLTYIAKGDRMKFDMPDGNTTVILDASRKQRITLDHKAKKYYVEALDANTAKQPSGKLVDTGETAEILGYPTRKIIFHEDRGGRYEIWATDGIRNKALTSMPGMSDQMKDEVMEIFGGKHVFPLKMIVFGPNGRELMRSEVIGVNERRVSNIEIALPTSYDDQYLVPKD